MSNQSPSGQDFYKIYRDRIKHEFDLINHRLGWLMLSQSFLIIAYIEAITSTDFHLLTIIVIILIGMMSSKFAQVSIDAAVIEVEALRYQFRKVSKDPPSHNFPEIVGTGEMKNLCFPFETIAKQSRKYYCERFFNQDFEKSFMENARSVHYWGYFSAATIPNLTFFSWVLLAFAGIIEFFIC